ncbi:hypothetical protein Afil01_16770 [Actinorhabdospora filicis]|uniref:LPXTG-motif cell wall-anchored protein n=1 Tax=Actinorhabdospora filicis TaxID=1785913 RepID=A0A9W6SGT5_9ACTN|nr:LPXTG cell wall anchor domain-containing protein [Actinorhabdospora filicis]GLZ76870.1 hypothetical protein Afil01_16770 [Actinorhabdospora filicis]
MSERFLQRTLVRSLLGATALAAGMLTLSPAASADEKLVLVPDIYDVMVTAGTSATQDLWVRTPKPVNATVAVKATVDLAALAGKVTLKGDGCTTEGTVFTCAKTLQLSDTDPAGYRVPLSKITFTAAPGATAPGARVTWRLTSDKSDPAEYAQGIGVREETKLFGDGDRSVDAKRGDKVAMPFTMRNGSTGDVRSPVVNFTVPLTFEPASWPSNCNRRLVGQGYEEYYEVSCAFDMTAKAGKAYRPNRAFEMTIAADTPVTGPWSTYHLGYEWSTRAAGGNGWTKGDGPALTLVPADKAPTSTKPDGALQTKMSGTDRFDLALTATPIKGKVGDKIKVTFTITNVGPVMVSAHEQRAVLANVAFGVPAGLKTDVKAQFGADDQRVPKELRGLHILRGDVYHLRAGEKMTFTATFTVEKAVPGASATATIFSEDSEAEETYVRTDADNGNHHITLKPEIAGGGPLAKTGVSAPAIAGVAGVLMLTGGGALLFGRRRRARGLA